LCDDDGRIISLWVTHINPIHSVKNTSSVKNASPVEDTPLVVDTSPVVGAFPVVGTFPVAGTFPVVDTSLMEKASSLEGTSVAPPMADSDNKLQICVTMTDGNVIKSGPHESI
jgi:hypothetical protein